MHQDNGNLGDVSARARSCLLLRRAREGERKHIISITCSEKELSKSQSVIDIHNKKLMIYQLV